MECYEGVTFKHVLYNDLLYITVTIKSKHSKNIIMTSIKDCFWFLRKTFYTFCLSSSYTLVRDDVVLF